ncbi:MAG: BatD family protein [Bacteroidales bacterium]|nr:BatD family protein [Bacteroidales bacterium]
MYKLFFSLTLMLIATTASVAQDVEITLSAPSKVNTGRWFRVEVSSNVQNARLGTPNFGELQVDYNSKSQSSSFSIINGAMTAKISTIYLVIAEKPGKYTIPGVKASYNGKTYTSNSVTIEAVGEDQSTANNAGGGQQNQQGQQGNTTNPNISDKKDLFIDLTVNKSDVYVGEQIIMTASLYSRYNISNFGSVNFTNGNGFWSKVIQNPSNISFARKTINGTPYLYAMLQKKLLFPQKAGNLTIDPYSIECIVGDPFGFRQARAEAKSTSKTIKVKPLPSEGKPENFGGAVGTFTISASTDKTDVKLDEPLTIKVTVSGSGNFQLFEAPKLNLPSAFEQFDPKPDDKTKPTDNGMTGNFIYSTVAIARQSGEFTIPPIQFHYFDPKSKQYKTASSKEITINVSGERDPNSVASSVISKTDIEDLGSDIRFIKQGDVKFAKGGNQFFNSFKFWMIFAIMIVLFFVVLIVRQQQIKNNANVIALKNRRAGKTSRKRLKLAETYINQNKKDEFYAEILNALWGYLSDKLAIPRAELSRDNVQEKLAEKDIDPAVTQKFIDTLDTCEFEHYAPESAAHPLSEMYTMAAEAIEQMETTIKA